MSTLEPTQLVPKSARWELVGDFRGEPAWDRVDPKILVALRQWPFSNEDIDWKEEGGLFRALIHDVSYEYRVWPRDYPRPGQLSFRRFAGFHAGDKGLSLGHETDLLRWVNEWGPPAEVIWFLADDPYRITQSPVLKLQYESMLMGLALRTASELSRANYNREAAERDLESLERLWHYQVPTGYTGQDIRSRGLEMVARIFSERLEDLSFGLSVNRFTRRLEHDFLDREVTGVDVNPTTPMTPFKRALRGFLRHTGGLVFSARFEEEQPILSRVGLSRTLQKVLWWQASRGLDSAPLVRCAWEKNGSLCPRQWFAEGKQKRDFEEGKRVWCPAHRNRRPRPNPEADREKAKLRMRRNRAKEKKEAAEGSSSPATTAS